MKCPTCSDATLVMSDRQGVEIDYCPQCRGVWLDRGELDKILERSVSAAPAPQPTASRQSAPQPSYEGDRGRYGHDKDYRHDRHDRHDKYDKRKKSWLYEIFD
ncbi:MULTISPECIES: zf-TFIIB domain-containing protein [unclassified Cupriavidus]|uniref:TFIIB-type zinc ribbon-containing protein n=1 Tax=unclassified Cupriavidus TaxID=2640874 RepID=UPI0013656FBD|nr:zf-TFIIB domain-containing protein [Cupriavidus sp. SW-Y-13]MWL90458.1 hypothetical protein [Cupriavidus sp. SW-Y-13]